MSQFRGWLKYYTVTITLRSSFRNFEIRYVSQRNRHPYSSFSNFCLRSTFFLLFYIFFCALCSVWVDYIFFVIANAKFITSTENLYVAYKLKTSALSLASPMTKLPPKRQSKDCFFYLLGVEERPRQVVLLCCVSHDETAAIQPKHDRQRSRKLLIIYGKFQNLCRIRKKTQLNLLLLFGAGGRKV